NPQAMRQRRETVEHPFGTLKMRMGATHFLMKRLPKVATEMALHVLAYNLTRVMNIVGVKPLLAAIRALAAGCLGVSRSLRMTSGSFRSVSRPRNRRKSQSARLKVLASQSEVALDRSETFLRNQDPQRTSAGARSCIAPLLT